jgi:serine protease inhibitor
MSQSVVGAINRFGFELLSLSIRSDKPCGICPLNVYQCLLMAAAGSDGRVLAGFEKALRFQTGSLIDRTRDSASLEEYSQSSPTVELNSVSSAWHDSLFEINQGWKEIVEGVFKAPVQPIELAPMNAFIKKGTKGKLKDLISEDSIKGCALMLITCLYFKAKWVESFDARDTVAGTPFFAFTGKPQKCFMMQRTGPMQYVDDPRMEICVLPYRAERGNPSLPRWKAAVFLPKLKGLEAIQDILSTFANEPSSLRNALSHANRAGRPNPEVKVRLPCFTKRAPGSPGGPRATRTRPGFLSLKGFRTNY